MAGMAAVNGLNMAEAGEGTFPAHPALGEGKGIFPGRVVWRHEPGAVSWDGVDYWWKPENFDAAKIRHMITSGIKRLTGAQNPAEAWAALFEWQNKRSGKSGGYRPGQKIAIKPNMNGAGEYEDDPHGRVASSYGNPVLLQALLASLVEDGGVRPEDITVYDTCRIFPDYMMAMCTEGALKGISFRHRDPGGPLDAIADRNARISWSGPIKGEATYLPKCVTEADYLIDLANVKGHSWGMTLGAKNHFGSFVNDDRRRTPAAAGLHSNIIGNSMGSYSCLVDLLANRHIGGKTMLWLLDGLIAVPNETVRLSPSNAKWQLPPFNGDFPCSLFLSQDPIALDSVGADFLVNEPAMRRHNGELVSNHGMENYLHEAALLPSPPSRTIYTDGAGGHPGSLGTHEHWNNPVDRQYSRNRGGIEGIELVGPE